MRTFFEKKRSLLLTLIICLSISGLYLSRDKGYTQVVRSFVAKKVLAINGTVNAPSISFISDPNTGIFRSSENVMELVAGGEAIASVTGNKLLMSFPLQVVSLPNANLPTSPSDGFLIYCADCTTANPCAGGGTGALAKRINGAWVCN